METPEASAADIWTVIFLGAMGAVTRISILAGNGNPPNTWQALATLISGTVFAGTGSGLVSTLIPGLGSVSLGFSAYIAGIFGMVLADYVVNRGFPKGEDK